MIAHIVLFTPRPELSDKDLRSFARSVMGALAAISSVKRSFVGRRIDVDPGYRRVFGDKTYEYAAVIEFDNREGLLSYLSDEKHLAVGTLFWKNCSSAVVSEVEEIGASELEDL